MTEPKYETTQQVFDVFCHAFLYGKAKRSHDGVRCRYLNDDGSRCAIGACIDDDTAKRWDNRDCGIRDISSDEISAVFNGIEIDFLWDLQSLHDDRTNWLSIGRVNPAAVEQFAEQYKLTIPAPIPQGATQ